MKRKRHSPEEIIRKLRQADAELAAGQPYPDTTTFTYDARHRLIRETRVREGTPEHPERGGSWWQATGSPGRPDSEPQTLYDLEYQYDAMGNRWLKYDRLHYRSTVYTYDTEFADPNALKYPTRNNRLLQTYETGPGGGRTVWYSYLDNGDVAHITLKDHGYDLYRDLYLVYGENGLLWLAIWQEWTHDPNDANCPQWPPSWQWPKRLRVTDAWEFRYDSGRERYLARHWRTRDPNDPNAIGKDPSQWVPLGSSWTDYLAEQPYVDFQVALDPNNVPEAIEQTRWLPGLGIHAGQTIDGQTNPVRYLHGDLIGSTLMTTDQLGEPVSYQVGGQGGPVVSSVGYTAFGELVIEWTDDQGQLHCQVGGELPAEPGGVGVSPVNRYWYAGAWGYETGGVPAEPGSPPGSDPNRGIIALHGPDPDLPPITLMHVGHRWYDPATGRFIQRDPLGLFGGLNVYRYCLNNALGRVDPLGLAWDWGEFADYVATGAAAGAVGGALEGGAGWLPGLIGGAAAGAAAYGAHCVIE